MEDTSGTVNVGCIFGILYIRTFGVKYVGGVDIVVPGMFYCREISVHGLEGILEFRPHTISSIPNITGVLGSIRIFTATESPKPSFTSARRFMVFVINRGNKARSGDELLFTFVQFYSMQNGEMNDNDASKKQVLKSEGL
ncbi:hypothetical protein LXL04_038929 [Taraxacum kok-saghyz]